jgi:lipoic acid synthetase/lipoate-protein ligase A
MFLITLPDKHIKSEAVLDGQRRLVFYLAMEEYVAAHLDSLLDDQALTKGEKEAFFVWQVPPTVIFGRNQVMDAEVNMAYCKEHGVKLFRRKSGGGCVYSDEGNIMLSYITNRTDVAFTFDKYLQLLTLALNKLGLKATRSGRNDVLVDGKKVSGNAFYLMPDKSVVHGTLLFDSDFDALESAITPSSAKIKSKGVASVRQHVTNLRPFLMSSDNPAVQALADIESFKKYLCNFFCDKIIELTDEQVAGIEEIEKTYLDPEFIAGRNNSFSMEFRKKIEGSGEFIVELSLDGDRIKDIHLKGDYFLLVPSADPDKLLTDRLAGCVNDKESAAAALKGLGLNKYVMNLTEEELIDMIYNN